MTPARAFAELRSEMARAHDRKKQKKLQKAKNKRTLARRKAEARQLPTSLRALIERAVRAPFGPCWVSQALTKISEHPEIVTVIVTRRVAGLFLPCVALVDRTCLGVKNAFVRELLTELELERLVQRFGENGDPLEPTELLTAQSVIHHAIDFAASLGFKPDPDFVPELIGERPATLLDTPLAHPERPVYISGPDDDVLAIVHQLETRVGRGNYDFVAGLPDTFDGEDYGDDEDDDLLDDEEDEALDVITTEGEEVRPESTDASDSDVGQGYILVPK